MDIKIYVCLPITELIHLFDCAGIIRSVGGASSLIWFIRDIY